MILTIHMHMWIILQNCHKNVVSQKSGNIHVVHMVLYTCNALRKIISSCKYIHWYPNCSDNMDVH